MILSFQLAFAGEYSAQFVDGALASYNISSQISTVPFSVYEEKGPACSGALSNQRQVNLLQLECGDYMRYSSAYYLGFINKETLVVYSSSFSNEQIESINDFSESLGLEAISESAISEITQSALILGKDNNFSTIESGIGNSGEVIYKVQENIDFTTISISSSDNQKIIEELQELRTIYETKLNNQCFVFLGGCRSTFISESYDHDQNGEISTREMLLSAHLWIKSESTDRSIFEALAFWKRS